MTAVKSSITLFMLFGHLPKYTFQTNGIKSIKQNSGVGMVVYTINPSIQKAEAARSLSSRPVWSTYNSQNYLCVEGHQRHGGSLFQNKPEQTKPFLSKFLCVWEGNVQFVHVSCFLKQCLLCAATPGLSVLFPDCRGYRPVHQAQNDIVCQLYIGEY